MIQISQIHADDIASLHFIERIYTESFPQDERRDFDEVVRLLRENDDFEIVMIADQEKPVGFISYWSWSDFTYMEHFAIDSHCRGAVPPPRGLFLPRPDAGMKKGSPKAPGIRRRRGGSCDQPQSRLPTTVPAQATT